MSGPAEVFPGECSQRQKVRHFHSSLLLHSDLSRILIILDLEVLTELGEYEKIGEPKPLEPKSEEDDKNHPTMISSNGFYGAKSQTTNPGGVDGSDRARLPMATSASATIFPIEVISPYSHKWTIKARCTSKSNIKTWHHSNSQGKLFSVNLLDDSGEIRATGFNDQCDMLYDLFQEGSVYYISSPCRVQLAKKQFSNLSNDYELTFERDTVVEKASLRDNHLPPPLIDRLSSRLRISMMFHRFDSTSLALVISNPLKRTPLLTSSGY